MIWFDSYIWLRTLLRILSLSIVFISLCLWLLARRIVCTFVWIFVIICYMGPHDHVTELQYVFPYSLWCFINSPPFVMAPFAKHWNVTDTHFLLNKAFIFIRLEFMELIVSAHFNNVDSLKHSLGSLGSAPASSC